MATKFLEVMGLIFTVLVIVYALVSPIVAALAPHLH